MSANNDYKVLIKDQEFFAAKAWGDETDEGPEAALPVAGTEERNEP